MVFHQSAQPIRLNTALGEDALGFRAMSMSEGFSRLYAMEIEAVAENADIDLDALLGRNLTVSIDSTFSAPPRHYNGFVSQALYLGRRGRRYGVRITARPWLWFLTLNQTCRIFADLSTPEIVAEVLSGHDFGDFEFRTEGDYPVRSYCVQYNETDYAFICRLLEHDGIFFFFEHQNGSHRLVFADKLSQLQTIEGYETFPFREDAEEADEYISDWRPRRMVTPGRTRLRDFDFSQPAADLEAEAAIAREHPLSHGEIFEWRGDYVEKPRGEAFARTRIEALQSGHSVVLAQGKVRGAEVGATFRLADHPVTAWNDEYAIVTVERRLSLSGYESGAAADVDFDCAVTATLASGIWRPARLTPRPEIVGPQTAMVVGAEGAEIDADPHGQVLLRFHWAPEGVSRRARVSQAWAGAQWGALSIPRIGQEVIVEFEEGDPDRPIVTGRVYNGASKPPYDPAKPTVAFKTNSSKGGGGFNELRFEDAKGEEGVFLHAEKDLDVHVKNVERRSVGADRHVVVGADEVRRVGGEIHETIAKHAFQTVGADLHVKVGGDAHRTAAGADHVDAGQDVLLTAGMNLVAQAGMDLHLKAGMKLAIEAPLGVSLSCGGNFITLGPGGVFIQGSMVMINSGGAKLAGPGSKAKKADEAKEPLKAKKDAAGAVDARPTAPEREPTPAELDSHPTSRALIAAHESGAPFCEQCERAAEAAET